MTKASAEWKVQLEGAVPGKLDSATYVNCASPGCHGSGWVDAAGKRWEGVPLYLVAGLVDDEQEARRRRLRRAARAQGLRHRHRDDRRRGRDHRLARHRRQDSVVLSAKVDGGELPDEYFPLRLVGPGLSDAQMPGGIARIVVRVK